MIKKICLSIILLVAPLLAIQQNAVMAASCDAQCQVKGGIHDVNPNAPNSGSLDDTITTVINLLSIAVGVVSIIMIIIAGFRYITSGGNADRTKAAKNTLIYAVVGLIIVALAQTIAHFVLSEAIKPTISEERPLLTRS